MYVDSLNKANGTSVISGFNNLIFVSGTIDGTKSIVMPNGFDSSVDENISCKFVFPNGHNCADSSTPLTLTINEEDILVVVSINGTLSPLPIHEITSGTYNCLQANTTLDMYYTNNYDGNNTPAFVVIGDPIVLSSASYTIYASGKIEKITEFYVTENSDITTTSKTFTLNNETYGIKQGDVIKITFTQPLQSNASNGILNFDIACYGVSGSVVTANPITSITNNPTSEYKYVTSHVFAGGNYSTTYTKKVFDANTTLELTWTGTYWLVMGDAVLCSYMGADGGYTVYANGLIEQYRNTPEDASQESNITWTFSVQFTNTNYLVTGGIWINNTGAISVKKELDYVKYTTVVQFMNIGAKFASGY